MAYINFYSIVDMVYSAEDKTVTIFGEMDMTKEVFALIAEGGLEDFCDRQEQVYRFDLSDMAEFKYCVRWINSQLKPDQLSLSFTEKLKLFRGMTYPKVLVDNETVRKSYRDYWKKMNKSKKSSK